jgi:PPK2 family polyphosphate:nucleotide phosphotransferase
MKRYMVKPGSEVDLGLWDPNETNGLDDGKKEARRQSQELVERLSELQKVLYAEGKRRILIAFQAMDTGGKDGTIRGVFQGVNPQGVRVVGFKKPTQDELAHDYLWRVHRHTPGRGQIVVFNRSHYEDVLVVRVHKLVPKKVWEHRFDHINAFERLLADEGTTILKFYLHIDLAEQKKRLQSRLDRPDKHWKFNPADLEERKLWPDYMRAYEDVLGKTSTPWAPWYIIPANRKWYRNLVVTQIIIDHLESLDMKYPHASFDPGKIIIE